MTTRRFITFLCTLPLGRSLALCTAAAGAFCLSVSVCVHALSEAKVDCLGSEGISASAYLDAVVTDLDMPGLCSVHLAHDSRADLVGEFKQWLRITSTLQEGPWQRARHFLVALMNVLSDAYSVSCGAVVDTTSGTFPAGRVFPPACLSNHINHK